MSAPGARLLLRPGREKSLLRRHPWVFSGAIGQVRGDPQPGDTVEVVSADGQPLALAAWSPASQIRARVWSFDCAETIDASWFRRRIEAAIARRRPLAAEQGLRLVHGESDGLPGVIADRYAGTLVLQLLACGAERWRDAIADALCDLTGCTNAIERSDADVRELEGLPPRLGPLRGAPPSAPLIIAEGGRHYRVDPLGGQKTGFYLDQRDNRAFVAAAAHDCEALDAFCYSGGFTVALLAGGARSVLALDSSAPALAMARDNVALNPAAGEVEWLEDDAFATLRRLRDAARRFDLIVLDPPKFAPTAQHAEKAARAYKDINLCALRLLRPGGMLFTFSCSGGVDAELFRKIVAGAALDAGVDALIERQLCAPADHPQALAFPEGAYLKGLAIRRSDGGNARELVRPARAQPRPGASRRRGTRGKM